jgi:hypothetical protein
VFEPRSAHVHPEDNEGYCRRETSALARQIEPLEAAYDTHLYRPGFFVGTGGPVTSYFHDFVSRRRVLEEEKRERGR